MVKKFASLLLSCICLISTSNSMDKLNIINDLSNTDNNINTITMSNIHPNNNIISLEEDPKEENNQEVSNKNTINNNQNNTDKKKKKKKKNKNHNNEQEIYERKLQKVSDIIKENVGSINNIIDKYIQSDKFKMLGTLHQKIMNSPNNEICNRFNINSYTLNKYKQYYDQLLNYIRQFMKKTGYDIACNNYNGDEQIKNIVNDIYKTLNSNNELTDVNDIMDFYAEEEIKSEEVLQGNNIFKIIANLAIAISDYILSTKLSYLQLINNFFSNNGTLDCSSLSKPFEQLTRIIMAFETDIK